MSFDKILDLTAGVYFHFYILSQVFFFGVVILRMKQALVMWRATAAISTAAAAEQQHTVVFRSISSNIN